MRTQKSGLHKLFEELFFLVTLDMFQITFIMSDLVTVAIIFAFLPFCKFQVSARIILENIFFIRGFK